ncbi:DUF3772 domain-containing protein [Acetobacter estunensis]|nr:DUF3772 domain-containing protein [Acetobacter estunensis]
MTARKMISDETAFPVFSRSFASCVALLSCLLLVFTLFAAPLHAADAPSDHDTLIACPSDVVSDKALDDLEVSIRHVFMARVDMHAGSGTDTVSSLTREASADEAAARAMVARLEPYEAIYKSFIEAIGKEPGKDEPAEAASVTAQRKRILLSQQDLKARLARARLYALEAHQIVLVLSQRNDAAQQARLLEHFPSPLTPAFWGQVRDEFPDTRARLSELGGEASDALAISTKGWRLLALFGILASAGIVFVAPFFLQRQIRRLAARLQPSAGYFRQILATAFFSGLCTLCAGGGALLIWVGLTNGADMDGTHLEQLAEMVGSQCLLAGFMLGASLSVLAPDNRDWRLVPLGNTAARALRAHALGFTVLLLVRGVLRYVDLQSGIGQTTVQIPDAAFMLATAFLLYSAPRQIVLHPASSGADEGLRQSLLGRGARVVAFGLSLFGVAALITGYIPLGYIVLSWICSMAVTLMVLALSYLLVSNMASVEFSSSGRMGRHLVSLGLAPRLVDQVSVVTSGLFGVFLVFVALAVAQSGGDFDFDVIVDNIAHVVSGQKIGNVSLSFEVLLECLALPILGHYIIHTVRKWLSRRFFPTTSLDLGAQTSILTILTYVAWILVMLTMMSALGVTVSSMTWVVSALSVGIGFGLQSIVQNFVSGLILLAERPVTIGDMVEIGGKVGDIRRISVRSTDLALSDGSTLIVPNSQFITSAVRNATFGRPAGSMAFSISLPLGTDLSVAISAISDALSHVNGLLKTPAPTVSLGDIKSDMVSLDIAGKTASPRDVSAAANQARLAVWEALHAKGVVATLDNPG